MLSENGTPMVTSKTTEEGSPKKHFDIQPFFKPEDEEERNWVPSKAGIMPKDQIGDYLKHEYFRNYRSKFLDLPD